MRSKLTIWLGTCLAWIALAPSSARACEALVGSEYTDPAEIVPMELDPSEWHVARRSRDDRFARKDYVRGNEDATQWNELVSWQISLGDGVRDLEAVKDQFLTTLGYQCPDVKSTVLRKAEGDLLFEWWHGDCYDRPAQHHLERLLIGKVGAHRLSHSHKGPKLPDSERDARAARLAGLRIQSRVPEGKLTPLQSARLALWRNEYPKALELLKPLAEKGKAEAQEELAGMYTAGWGVPQSYPQALEWFKKAAEQKNVAAMMNLGRLHDSGWGVPRDPAEALKWYRAAAEFGDSHAQGRVGYLLATAPEPRYDEALTWFRRSADQGHEPAVYWLGRLHEEGWGVEKNLDQAVTFYRKAAVLGDPDAQYRLGVLHREGRGVPRDDAQARTWIVRAVMQGQRDAQELFMAHYRPAPVLPIPDKVTLEKQPWNATTGSGKSPLPPGSSWPDSGQSQAGKSR